MNSEGGTPLSEIKRRCNDCGRYVLHAEEKGGERHQCKPEHLARLASEEEPEEG